MKFRLPFRHRTAPAAADTGPAWEQPGHFKSGDTVHMPPDSVRETVVWVEGDLVGVEFHPRFGPSSVGTSDVRHLEGCEPCMVDARRQGEEEQAREETYWAQWPDEDRDLYDRVMEGRVVVGDRPRRYRFGDRTPVREWMRTELDGHLLDDEMPSLTMGRIWDPVDWPRLEREYGDDGLTIINPWETVLWPTIRSAFVVLQQAGYSPALDASVEMDRLDDGTIGAEVIVSALMVDGPIDADTYGQAVALLGDATEFPHTWLRYESYPDRPGRDLSQPYQPDERNVTGWNWSGGDWMGTFNPPAQETTSH
ncbi:hypothetical protein ACFOSC_27705 [Streptantibioticus rubrisoli]|uniref:Uncharacterized protein n=1 Tax=Streptantibioticus rubrisoli TaxID=1387313 RepID=A0ABT1PKB4_9ACTN|nr:hypothetical protein [Streptantibioticus rubrisoli]MCQ4045801.1 hypothetical protein [Streptantibioticus rubrisoli]